MPLLIVAAAVCARVLAAMVLFRFYQPSQYCHQGLEIISTALSLNAHQGFSSPFFTPSGPTAFLTPGYPLLMAFFFRLLGTGAAAAIVLVGFQILLSVLSVCLLMSIARLHFGARTSYVAGWICALALPMVMAPMRLWDTSLSALMLLGMFVLAPSRAFQFDAKAWWAAGAACGVAGLVNPALLPTLFLIWAWSVWQSKRVPWAGMLAFALVFSCWPVRNLVMLHAPIPLRSNFGYELWMGNHAGGDGDFVEAIDPMANLSERAKFVSEGELAFMREKSDLAKSYIRAHPAEFVRLTVHRIGRFWMGTANGDAPFNAPLVLLALPGLVLLGKRRRLLVLFAIPLLIFPLPYYVTHPDVRFQYVIDPVLAILAAVALDAALIRLTAVGRKIVTTEVPAGCDEMRIPG